MVINITDVKPIPIPEPVYESQEPHAMVLYTCDSKTAHFRFVNFVGRFYTVTKRDGNKDTFLETTITRSDCSHNTFVIMLDQSVEDLHTKKRYYIDIININPDNNCFVFRVSDFDDIPKAS